MKQTREDEFREMEKKLKGETLEIMDPVRSLPKMITIFEKYTTQVKFSPLEAGHQLVDKIRKELTLIGRRSASQICMHELILKCCTKLIYGSLADEFAAEIMERNGWDNLLQEIIITAPRRFGKSLGVAMIVSILLYYVKGIDLAIFSSSSRASGKNTGIAGLIEKFLINHFKLTASDFSVNNQEDMFIKFSDQDIRKLHAYPGSVRT